MKPKKIKFKTTISTPEGFLRENLILEAPFSKIVEAEIEFGVGTIEVLEYEEEEKKQEEPKEESKEEPKMPVAEKKVIKKRKTKAKSK
jgi:hypothetical protein